MKRKEKEIIDPNQIQAVMDSSIVCRLGMTDVKQPYVVPLCFGYEDNCLYFHCPKDGKKIDILKENNNICFEFDIDQEIVPADTACKFGMKYRSVIGFGKAYFIEDNTEKRKALDIIVGQYSDKNYDYPEDLVDHITIIKVEIESMTGKQSGF